MPNDILEMLGGEPQQKQANPQQEESVDKIDSELLAQMMTADGGDGNFELSDKEKKELQEPFNDEEDVKTKTSSVKEQLGKYSDEFIKDVMAHPTKYTVDTSRGRMTIKEAIDQGWNPETGEFDEETFDSIKEEELSKLSDSERGAVEELMNPANAGFAAADAEALGIPGDSPMIRGNQALGAAPMPAPQQPQMLQGQPDPAAIQQTMGGMM